MSDFTLDFVSRNEYEFLAVEMSFRGQLLCEINSERGLDHLEVEFLHDSRVLSEGVPLTFPVAEFANEFAAACAALVEANGIRFQQKAADEDGDSNL